MVTFVILKVISSVAIGRPKQLRGGSKDTWVTTIGISRAMTEREITGIVTR